MQVTESGNSFLDYSLPICWALRNRKCLRAFLIYEGTIRPGWLTLATQVPRFQRGTTGSSCLQGLPML